MEWVEWHQQIEEVMAIEIIIKLFEARNKPRFDWGSWTIKYVTKFCLNPNFYLQQINFTARVLKHRIFQQSQEIMEKQYFQKLKLTQRSNCHFHYQRRSELSARQSDYSKATFKTKQFRQKMAVLLQDALKLHPDSKLLLILIGEATLDKHIKSNCFLQLISFYPNELSFSLVYAESLLQLKQYVRAEKIVLNSIVILKQKQIYDRYLLSQFYLLRGDIYHHLFNPESAIQSYKISQKIRKSNRKIAVKLIKTALLKYNRSYIDVYGDILRWKRQFSNEIYFKHLEALCQYALMYTLSDEQWVTDRRHQANKHTNQQSNIYLGHYCEAMKSLMELRYEECIENLLLELANNQYQANIHWWLACCYFRMLNFHSSLEYFQKLQNINVQSPIVSLRIAINYIALNQSSKARDIIQQKRLQFKRLNQPQDQLCLLQVYSLLDQHKQFFKLFYKILPELKKSISIELIQAKIILMLHFKKTNNQQQAIKIFYSIQRQIWKIDDFFYRFYERFQQILFLIDFSFEMNQISIGRQLVRRLWEYFGMFKHINKQMANKLECQLRQRNLIKIEYLIM